MVGRRAVEARIRFQLQAHRDGFLLERRLPFEDAQRIIEAGVFDLRKTVRQLPLQILGRELHPTVGIQQGDSHLQQLLGPAHDARRQQLTAEACVSGPCDSWPSSGTRNSSVSSLPISALPAPL